MQTTSSQACFLNQIESQECVPQQNCYKQKKGIAKLDHSNVLQDDYILNNENDQINALIEFEQKALIKTRRVKPKNNTSNMSIDEPDISIKEIEKKIIPLNHFPKQNSQYTNLIKPLIAKTQRARNTKGSSRSHSRSNLSQRSSSRNTQNRKANNKTSLYCESVYQKIGEEGEEGSGDDNTVLQYKEKINLEDQPTQKKNNFESLNEEKIFNNSLQFFISDPELSSFNTEIEILQLHSNENSLYFRFINDKNKHNTYILRFEAEKREELNSKKILQCSIYKNSPANHSMIDMKCFPDSYYLLYIL